MLLYEKAKAHFEKTKKPPRSKNYTDNERPLRRVNEPFLKLVREPHSYLYKLNGKDCVRAYEPDENGNYQVCIDFDGYYSTDRYMGLFAGVYDKCRLMTTDDREVRLPLNWKFKKQGKDFSAVLTFSPEGKLIVDQSWHADVYRKQSNDADKSSRKFIRDKISDLVTLQMFKMPAFRAGAVVSSHLGKPFSNVRISVNDHRAIHNVLKSADAEQPQEFIDAFDSLAQSVFNGVVSKRIYNEHGYKGFYSQWSAKSNPNHPDEIYALHKQYVDAVTTEDLRVILERKVVTMMGFGQGSEFVALPQFMDKLPTKYYLGN